MRLFLSPLIFVGLKNISEAAVEVSDTISNSLVYPDASASASLSLSLSLSVGTDRGGWAGISQSYPHLLPPTTLTDLVQHCLHRTSTPSFFIAFKKRASMWNANQYTYHTYIVCQSKSLHRVI